MENNMPNKESQFIEFKLNWRDEYLKAISSFANDKGGELIIGMDDHGNPVGLKNAKRLLEDLPNKIRNKLGIIPSLEIEKKNKVDIVKVIVRPSSVPISYDGRFYVRSGSTIQELQGKDLADFLMKKSGVTWDEVCEERATLNELNSGTIEKFKKYTIDRIPSITEEIDIQTLLEKLKLIDHGRIKRGAILLFGNNPQQLYLQSVVKIGKFLSNTDIQFTDIINGNLFQQLENTIEILRSKYLVSNIKYEGIHRRDLLEYPYEALREAVINALIHRDYSGTSHIQIRVYSDRLVIMNEGKLPPEVPVEKLKTDHLSKPRNRLLAEIFYYAGFIEAWGRGTLKIVDNCLQQGLPEPDFLEENNVMSVVFYKDMLTEQNLKELGLHERQIKAMKYIKETGRITNHDYQEMFGIKKRQATDDLSNLVEMKLIERIGKTGKGTYYILKRR
jgi:ATP-dependent DNA helicase RecG